MADYAILIGIDDYPGKSHDLNASARDVGFWTDVFRTNIRIPLPNIRALLNGQATRGNLNEAWKALASTAGAGDRIYFFYSGHGQVTRDLEWPSPDADECFLLHDGPFAASRLADMSQQAATKSQMFILDCCFSGGFALPQIRTKSSPPPEGRPPSPPPPSGIPKGVILSACAANQPAAAGSKRTGGLSAFSYSMQFIRAEAGSLNAPIEELCQYSTEILGNLGFSQKPDARGDALLLKKNLLTKGP